HGHVEHHAVVAELGGTTWLDVEPGTAAGLLGHLESMRFLLRVEPRDATGEWAVLTLLGPQVPDVLTRLGVVEPPRPYRVASLAGVHNLGRPPRRMVLLHTSGESEQLPAPGTPVESGGRAVGRVGTAVRHHELGQVALALVKRTVADDAALTVAGVSAAIDPDPAPSAPTAGAGRAARASLARSDTMRP